jgi:hypothetical protein
MVEKEINEKTAKIVRSLTQGRRFGTLIFLQGGVSPEW